MAKPGPPRKLERDNQLVQYKKAHPDISLREIGKAFNISRQRVFQIFKRDGVKNA